MSPAVDRRDPRQCSARGQQFRVQHRAAHLPRGGGGGVSAGGVGHGALPTCAPATRFALLISFLFGVTALGRYWFRLSLVPQPERYHLEMDMAFWLALAFLAWPWVARIPRRAAWGVGDRGGARLRADRRAPAPRGARLGQAHRYPHHHRVQDRQVAGRPHAGAARLRARHHRLLAQRLQRRSAAHRRLRQRHRESLRCRTSSTRSTPATSSRSESTC